MQAGALVILNANSFPWQSAICLKLLRRIDVDEYAVSDFLRQFQAANVHLLKHLFHPQFSRAQMFIQHGQTFSAVHAAKRLHPPLTIQQHPGISKPIILRGQKLRQSPIVIRRIARRNNQRIAVRCREGRVYPCHGAASRIYISTAHKSLWRRHGIVVRGEYPLREPFTRSGSPVQHAHSTDFKQRFG